MDANYKVKIKIGYAETDIEFKEFDQAAEFVKCIIDGTNDGDVRTEIRPVREEAQEDE